MAKIDNDLQAMVDQGVLGPDQPVDVARNVFIPHGQGTHKTTGDRLILVWYSYLAPHEKGHMQVCALDSGTQGLRGASLEINRVYNHFQKVFMKTPAILGALNPKIVGMGTRGHMAGVISSKSCMQVVSATSDEIW